MRILLLMATALLLTYCASQVSEEKRPFVEAVNEKVGNIDANHRVSIKEENLHQGDSSYTIRGYFLEDNLLKLVGVLHTSVIDRDDYFYFENNAPIFSGHLVVQRENQKASEFKFYYGEDGFVKEALSWSDTYVPGERFPMEHFLEFEPNNDSLRSAEETRLVYFLTMLGMEGFEIKHLNEN